MAKLQLAVGSFGEEVKNLHRKLIKHGLGIPSSEVDRSFFGPATRDAILQWQRTHGLPLTAIVDERTDATLEAAPQSGRVQPESSALVGPPLTAVRGSTPKGIFAREISEMFAQVRDAAGKGTTQDVTVNGTVVP